MKLIFCVLLKSRFGISRPFRLYPPPDCLSVNWGENTFETPHFYGDCSQAHQIYVHFLIHLRHNTQIPENHLSDPRSYFLKTNLIFSSTLNSPHIVCALISE